MNIIHEINIEPNNHIQNNNEANNLPVNELRCLKSRLKSDTPIHECINLFEEMCQIPLNDDLILPKLLINNKEIHKSKDYISNFCVISFNL